MKEMKICGKKADKLFSRGFGRREKNCIYLSWVEALYLVEKGLIEENFERILKKSSSQLSSIDIRYLVYRDLRERGYVLRVEDDHFVGRKNYSMAFYPLSDMDFFQSEKLLSLEMPLILSIVDGDGDITYYLVDLHEPQGNYFQLPSKKTVAHFYGRRYFVFEDAEEMVKTTYGKDEGLFGHLSIWEARYLKEKELLECENGNSSREYEVYRDLRNKGLIVKSGFKYGTHFRAYEDSMEEHSKYLVHVISEKEELQKVSRAVRVAHGVRKTLLLAYIKEGKIRYFKVAWIRP